MGSASCTLQSTTSSRRPHCCTFPSLPLSLSRKLTLLPRSSGGESHPKLATLHSYNLHQRRWNRTRSIRPSRDYTAWSSYSSFGRFSFGGGGAGRV